MQDERGIVERLRAMRDGLYEWMRTAGGALAQVPYGTGIPDSFGQSADIIEAQAKEIARLKEELAKNR